MKKRLSIIFIMVLSFFAANLVNNEVFVANSPVIRPNLPEYLAGRVQGGMNSQRSLAERLLRKLPEQQLEKLPLEQLNKGVYARTEKNYSQTVIKINEIEWIEYTFTIKGKEVKIQVPRGQQPPTQELLEKVY